MKLLHNKFIKHDSFRIFIILLWKAEGKKKVAVDNIEIKRSHEVTNWKVRFVRSIYNRLQEGRKINPKK